MCQIAGLGERCGVGEHRGSSAVELENRSNYLCVSSTEEHETTWKPMSANSSATLDASSFQPSQWTPLLAFRTLPRVAYQTRNSCFFSRHPALSISMFFILWGSGSLGATHTDLAWALVLWFGGKLTICLKFPGFSVSWPRLADSIDLLHFN